MLQNTLNQFARVLLLSSILCFISCQKKDSQFITIGILDGPSTVSFIKMINQPPKFKGRTVKFVIKSDPLQIQTMMMQDQLDFAILPTVMAANLYNKGIDYRLLAIPIWGTLYLAANDPSIQNIDQLNNQTVHVFGQGATADILLQTFMRRNKIDNVKIDYSYGTNQELAMALLHKKITVAVISEPQMSMLLLKDTNINILTEITCEQKRLSYDRNLFAQTSFLVNSKLAVDCNEIVHSVSSAYEESCHFTSYHTDEAAKLLLKHGYYPDLITAFRSIPLCNIHYVQASAIRDKVNRYLKIFLNTAPRSVGEKMPNKEFIYSNW